MILTLLGAGAPAFVGLVGMMLCAVGMMQRSVQVDLWVLLPLVLYNFLCMASAYAASGNIAEGYTAIQIIFPVLYLLLACVKPGELKLLRRLCILWSGGVAAGGILRFVFRALLGKIVRMGWPVGSPNALGVFLVVAWFALAECRPEGETNSVWERLLRWCEPLILMALALTLSMGSFVSMAAGILVMIIGWKRQSDWRETFFRACGVLAKATLGIGTGVLLYVAADRSGSPWLCLLPLAYAGALVLGWGDLERLLRERPWVAAAVAGMGVLVAAGAVAMRPSSIATFQERLEMMRNAAGYLTVSPVLGVGPFQWRLLNLADSDKYFNVWYIHNALLHIAVEAGLPAAGMLLAVTARFCRKRKTALEQGEFAAFFLGNMLDVSMFFPGITGFLMITTGEPRQGGKTLGAVPLRCLLAAYGVLCLYVAYMYW